MANEKRLIDANALLKELDKFINPMPDEKGLHFLNGICTAITEIEEATTVDAVEVVHGRWRWRKDGVSHFYCSVCEKGVPYSYTAHNYCPNCGAKMDGGDEDG